MSNSSSDTELIQVRRRAVQITIPSNRQRVRSTQKYYACHDMLRPVCRQFVNQGRCSRNLKCRFYHPPKVTKTIKRLASREPGHCFCGAPQRILLNKKGFQVGESEEIPTFFAVCGRTGRSMRKCM